MNSRPALILLALVAVVYSVCVLRSTTRAENSSSPSVERARREVRLLDDIYKTAVVLITEKYIHDEDDFSSGEAAMSMLSAMAGKGWHEARLLDATGRPKRRKNSASDAFERDAVSALRSGESYYERIEVKEGRPFLRAATPVPVISEKCVMCHSRYEEEEPGATIGVFSYELEIR